MVEHSNYKKEGYFTSFKKEDNKKISDNDLETFEISSDRYKKSRMKVRIVKYEIKD